MKSLFKWFDRKKHFAINEIVYFIHEGRKTKAVVVGIRSTFKNEITAYDLLYCGLDLNRRIIMLPKSEVFKEKMNIIK